MKPRKHISEVTKNDCLAWNAATTFPKCGNLPESGPRIAPGSESAGLKYESDFEIFQVFVEGLLTILLVNLESSQCVLVVVWNHLLRHDRKTTGIVDKDVPLPRRSKTGHHLPVCLILLEGFAVSLYLLFYKHNRSRFVIHTDHT